MAQGFLARVSGRIQQIFAITSSSGAGDADKIPALGSDGRLDQSMMPVGVGANVVVALASENLSAGRLVNLFYSSGQLRLRLADNSNSRAAWGYVKESVSSGDPGTAYRLNTVNASMTGLTPGADYWLGTAGGVISTPLDPETETGKICQHVGMASSATELVTVEHSAIYL